MNIRIAIVPISLLFVGISSGQSFLPPIDNLQVGQAFAEYGAVTAGKYHTGMDISRSGLPSYEQRTTNVKVARAGTVYKIFGLYRSGNNLRRWNAATNTYDWVPSPIPYNQPGGNNHGLGICVVVYHPDLKLYSLYGHLDAVVSTLYLNQSLIAGQIIGKLGNSYGEYLRKCSNYGSSAHNHQSLCVNTAPDAPAGSIIEYTYANNPGFAPHVHFEVKDRGVISARRTDDEGPDWGYTPGNTSANMPGHPNWFGYHDPNLFLNNSVELLSQPLPVEVLQFPLNVRSYPSTTPPIGSLTHVITTIAQRTDGRLPAFVASRRIGNQWYQIYLPNDEVEGWSASGWIAGTLGSTQYSRENSSLQYITVMAASARVYSQPSTSSSTLVFVYGGDLIDKQKFVTFASPAGWRQVYLPQKSSQPDGFILQSALPVQPTVGSVLPTNFVLAQNYPNPFNPSTTIEFALPKSVHATLKIFDLLGREVATLVDEELPAGNYKREWHAQDMASGVYVYRLHAGEFSETKKLMLLR
jgi:murein DD-endopeptidase MepM/ murein hydrolase activator NlpD